MSILKTISLILIVTVAISCSEAKTEQVEVKNETVLFRTDTINPDSTIIGFLRWYRDNENRLQQIHLLTGGLKDTTTFYSVDFKATEHYLLEIKKSGYVSETFLDEVRKHFIQSNAYLKQHPQNDGPAPGFEADLIMKSQDYMDVWSNLDHAIAMDKKITGNRAEIKMLFAGYYKTRYYLTNYRNRWLIDSINNAFSED